VRKGVEEMSILINIEMPTSPVLFCIHPDGKVFADLEGNWREYKAVPVPPHGRLIDADEMFVEFVIEGQRSKRYKLGEKWELNGEEIRSVISRFPTIIPAEEGE
jgi:hypothetical protein